MKNGTTTGTTRARGWNGQPRLRRERRTKAKTKSYPRMPSASSRAAGLRITTNPSGSRSFFVQGTGDHLLGAQNDGDWWSMASGDTDPGCFARYAGLVGIALHGAGTNGD